MQPLHVIKIGGAVIDEPGRLQDCLDGLSQLTTPFILVHGGGRHVDQWLTRIGHEIRMVHGRRITDDVTLELAVMAYAGWINKTIVSGLQARGKASLGLSGADLDSIRAHKRIHSEIDFGWVGDIDEIKGEVYHDLITRSITPVCCALTHDGHGQLLNTNADTIASRLAAAMSDAYDVTLWYAFEKRGVLFDVSDRNSLIPEMNQNEYNDLLQENRIHSGMKPKLDNCFSALHAGVKVVYILSSNDIGNIPEASGTKVYWV